MLQQRTVVGVWGALGRGLSETGTFELSLEWQKVPEPGEMCPRQRGRKSLKFDTLGFRKEARVSEK